MSFSSAERARLVALFHELGPDAPTLCEGWTTRDLAAHLWVRENRPDAAGGMFISKLAPRLEAATEQALRRDYDELVDAWGRGASKANPMRYLDSVINKAEHFVHLEDVRRANGQEEERELSRAAQEELFKALKLAAPRFFAKSTQPVVLYPEGFERIVTADKNGVADKGGAVVRVHGSAPELLLWAFGRDAAHVEIVGDANAVVRSSV